ASGTVVDDESVNLAQFIARRALDVQMVEVHRRAFELLGVDISQPQSRLIHTLPPVGDPPSKNHASTGPLLSAGALCRDGRGGSCSAASRSAADSRSLQMEPDAYLSRLGSVAGGVRRTGEEDRRVCRVAGDAGEGAGAVAGGNEAVRRHRTAHVQG